jgi:hypothetical protein
VNSEQWLNDEEHDEKELILQSKHDEKELI